jgi:sulfate adenylyltransferase subunit 1 (EFTu-like GTPase family)
MDLVGYSQDVFEQIRGEFLDYAPRLQSPDLHFIPISALKGDNVVEASRRMPWFDGSSLLHYLETVHVASDRNLTEARFPVQYVLRPDLDFRGYAGQVASGVIHPGDEVMVLPSGRRSRIKSILSFDGELPYAFPPMSVTVCLEDDIDISRGDMLVPPSHSPHVTRRIDARIVWMDEQEMEIGRTYLLKHTSQTVKASVSAIRYSVDIASLEKQPASRLHLNDIGAVVIETQKPLFCDPYRRNRATGSFILIDPMTNATVAAGMITGREPLIVRAGVAPSEGREGARHTTRKEHEARAGHRAVTVWMETAPELAYEVERLLFEANYRVHALDASGDPAHIAPACRILNDAGVIALVCGGSAELEALARASAGEEAFVEIPASASGDDPVHAADRICLLISEQCR